MRFRNRISGQSVEAEQLPERMLFGCWFFDPSDAAAAVRINGWPADAGDALTPGAAGDCALIRPGDTIPTRGRFFADPLPDEQDVEALLQLGGLLRDAENAKGGWLEWSETSPLAPGLDKAIEPHPFEDRIEAELDHLVAVCRKPRTHIRVETERVLVARARRIAPNAPAWLASHTEDWDHRKISGIQPRRILAEVREEQWDLYENRAAVRLVDNLVTWLRRRIAEVRRILDDILARVGSFGESVSGTRHRAERIYRMWGEAWDASQGREIAERTLKRLDRLLYRTLGLMDSRLYRRIPKRAPAPRALRMTNLLRNDDHYRGIARLWHEWSQLAALRALSPRELYVLYQNLRSGFDAWCMLLVVRACSQLRLDPGEDDGLESEIRPGCSIRLDGGFRVAWEKDGSITLADGDKIVVRFIPVAHALERARTRKTANARIDSLVGEVADAALWTVILHPAVPGKPPHDLLAGIGNPPDPSMSGAIDFIRVSPFSLDSVERVSRAIRWATLARRMLAYPPTLQAIRQPDMVKVARQSSWQADRGGSSWAMVQPPRPNERSGLNIEGRLEKARSDRDHLVQEQEEVQEALKKARGDRRRMAELNAERRRLREPAQNAKDVVEHLVRFEGEFESARVSIMALARCPACGGGDVHFEARENDCFAARCKSTSCSTRWELRCDPDTRDRVPVLLPSDARSSAWQTNAAPQTWIDDELGCDVLAVPASRTGDGVGFLPPRARRFDDSSRTIPRARE